MAARSHGMQSVRSWRRLTGAARFRCCRPMLVEGPDAMLSYRVLAQEQPGLRRLKHQLALVAIGSPPFTSHPWQAKQILWGETVTHG